MLWQRSNVDNEENLAVKSELLGFLKEILPFLFILFSVD